MAPKPQTNREDQTQRDKINRMDFTLTDVVLPALKSIQTDQKIMLQKDFMTRAEAETKFSSKDETKFLKNIIYTLGAAFAAYIMATAFGLFGGIK